MNIFKELSLLDTLIIFIVAILGSGLLINAAFNIDKPVEGKTYNIAIIDEIGDPRSVYPIINTYVNAKKGDTVILHLASPGGEVNSMDLIIAAIQASKAKTVMIVEGDSFSAAAVIAVSGNELVMRPSTFIMFHTTSAVDLDCTKETGKDRGVSNVDHCLAFKKAALASFESRLNSIKLLTDDEKAYILTGHDIYLSAEEIDNRYHGTFTSQVPK